MRLLCLALIAAACAAVTLPFPRPQQVNASSIVVVNDDPLTDDQRLAVATLQGWSSRSKAWLFRNSSQNDAYLWLQELESAWGVQTQQAASFGELLCLAKSAGFPTEFVLADSAVGDSVLAAVTAASLCNVPVVATLSTQAALRGAGYSLRLDARNMTTLQVLNQLNGTAGCDVASDRVAVLQDPSKLCCLWDYAAFAGGVAWYDALMIDETTKRVLDSLAPASAIVGWGASEFVTVSAASLTKGSWVHAADWAHNLAALTSFALGPDARQPNAFPSTAPSTKPVHTVTFLMSDGDNLQWLLNDFATGPAWWGAPQRGSVPMGWTLSAALADLGPAVLTYLYQHATIRSAENSSCDVFVAAPSGAGYAYPDEMSPQGLAAFADATGQVMTRSGLSIVNVIADSFSSQAAQALASQQAVDALFWYDYAPYDKLAGQITQFSRPGRDRVPSIGARFMLWEGFDSPETLAPKLRAMPTDPTSQDGYSLIVVNAWSSNVTQVSQTIDLLSDALSIEFVCPDEFVARIIANVA
jgi:hypothetical protein